MLPYIGEGENSVPTIHITDLARLVRRVVIEDPKVHPYIFAIDKTTRPTQKRLIQAISKGIGTDKVASVAADSIDDSQGWKQFLTINLLMKASNAFKRLPEDPQKVEDLGDEEDQLEAYKKSLKFPWHAKQGIIGCIKKLNIEFNEKRDLKPVKIFMTGPPASGKTHYSD